MCFIALSLYVDCSLSEVERTSSDSRPELFKCRMGRRCLVLSYADCDLVLD